MNFKKVKNIIKEELRASKPHIFFVISIFLLTCVSGFVFASHLGFIDSIIKDILEKVEGLNGISLIAFIFLNNAQSAFAGMIFGLAFGIFPVFNAILNGTVIGYVLSRVAAEGGYSEFWRILPHGVFELPAIFISLGLGLRLGMSFFTKSWKKELGNRIYRACVVFLFVVIPLLVIAALIEGLLITFYK